MYDRKLAVAEVRARIDRYHAPYHAALAAIIDRLHARFGAVWHVDCHSTPSVGSSMSADGPKPRPDFVVSDRKGVTCDPNFTAHTAAALRAMGYRVKINDP